MSNPYQPAHNAGPLERNVRTIASLRWLVAAAIWPALIAFAIWYFEVRFSSQGISIELNQVTASGSIMTEIGITYIAAGVVFVAGWLISTFVIHWLLVLFRSVSAHKKIPTREHWDSLLKLSGFD